MLTARVYSRAGCVTEKMIVEMEVMKLLIVDLNVVSILIRYSPYGSLNFFRYSLLSTFYVSRQFLFLNNSLALMASMACELGE